MAGEAVVRTIDFTKLGFPATAKPHYIVVEPDGVALVRLAHRRQSRREVRSAGSDRRAVRDGDAGHAGAGGAGSARRHPIDERRQSAEAHRDRRSDDDAGRRTGRAVPAAASGGGHADGLRVHGQPRRESDRQHRARRRPRRGHRTSPARRIRSCSSRVTATARRSSASTEISGQLLVFDLAQPAQPQLVKSIDVGKMAFDPVFTPDEADRLGAGQEHE